MERLSDQLEGCEEAESIRRTDLAQQVQTRLLATLTPEEGAQVSVPEEVLLWPGEELVAEEGFTPRAMLAVTNSIREACATMSQHAGGPAAVSPGLLLLMLGQVEELLRRRGLKALVEFLVPPGERIVVVGDLHGQLKDALWIFYRYGLPSEAAGNCYLFNGDIADRGAFSVEIFVLALGWMLAFPNAVFMNRGNHEDLLVNTSRCGGFYDECRAKYPEHCRQVFEAFGRVFAALPLAYLFGPPRAKVLVVHGGLPRVPTQMLPTLRHMSARGPTVSMRTASLEEVVLKDALWSDPQDKMGQEVSTRGPNLIRFGPDVTLKFCQEEGVGLVVRSHEVPPSGEGFAFQHHNRLCTVFSASNYKGIEHNSGAVLLITSKDLAVGQLAKSVRPEVYYAPKLREACAQALEPPRELLETPAQLSSTQHREAARLIDAARAEAQCRMSVSQEDPAGEQIREEVMHVVGELVVAHKEELWRALWDKDAGVRSRQGARTGFVSLEVWKDVCQSVLGATVSWDAVGSILQVVEALAPHRGAVDYNHFLHRFHVTIREDGCVRATWIDQVLASLVDKLLSLSVQELLDTFDQDKNGRLTIPELAEAFKNLDAGMAPAQIRALFLTFAVHCDEAVEEDIEVEAFLSALVVAAQESGQKQHSKHARARSAWPKWAKRHLRLLGKEIWERGEHHLLDQFKASDADGSGLLEPSEFVQIMRNLQVQCTDPAALALPAEALGELARLADFDGGGSVSYMEILLALQPADTALGGHVRFDLFEQICATVWCNQEALLRAFHTLDPERTMRASAATLTRALQQLNCALAGDMEARKPLLPFQIEALVSHIQFDESGLVDYSAFLDAFQVVDCAA